MKRVLLGISISFLLLLLQACGGSGGSNSDDETDTTPDAFYFTDQYGLGLGIYVESNTLEISGIDAETDISIEGGEYSINGGEFTDQDGTIIEGQNVTLRVLSSEDLYTSASAVLTIGDVSDTFYVRTTSLGLNVRYNFKSLSFYWQEVGAATYYRLWYQPHADADFEQVGRDLDASTTGTRMEIAVHTFDWFNAQFKLEACTNTECFSTRSVGVVNERSNAVGYVKSANTEAFDNFSFVALSADGNTLAVGAPAEDGNAGIDGDLGSNAASGAGAVYIYRKEGLDWTFQTYIKALNAEAGDAFGSALSLSGDGNTLAVGAPFEASSALGVDADDADNSAANAGAVYVYKRIGDIWLAQSYIKASDTATGDLFGSSVALSTYGETLAVGAPGKASGEGAAYIYTAGEESWLPQADLSASNAEAGDSFGYALALTADGDELVVGAPYESSNSTGLNMDQADNNAPFAGAAYVYARTGSDWQFDSYIKASNTAENQMLGSAVAISANGKTLALGAPGEASNAYGVNGDESDTSYPGSGAAYVFSRDASNGLVQQAYIKASDGDLGDSFGSALSINATGKLLVVAALGEDSANDAVDSNDSDNSAVDAGAAYVFALDESQWQQLRYVKAPNTDAGDKFGSSISLDASGKVLAIGAPGEDSHSTDVASSQGSDVEQDSGAAYLF
ncbi:hypothetical protein [Teredinibacter haidensis]|uniref:hypothetical protein n=1 Tax=Teredinibacter haidensis TaxID=2731755 RepID=UPI00094890B8|nr:hypothetical protein [Teredinibacter haidensis]